MMASFAQPFLGRESENIFPVSAANKDVPFPTPLYVIVLDKKFITPYTQNWSLTVEREIFSNTLVRVGYVGTKSTHLKSEYDQNAPIYNTNLSLIENRNTVDDRRPIKDFLTISRWMPGLNQIYHSLQVSVDKRYSQRLHHQYRLHLGEESRLRLDQRVRRQPRHQQSLRFLLLARALEPDARASFHELVCVGPAVGQRATRRSRRFWAAGAIVASLRCNRGGRSKWSLEQPHRRRRQRARRPGRRRLPGARFGPPQRREDLAEYFDKSRFANPAPNTFGTLGRNSMVGPGFCQLRYVLDEGLAAALHQREQQGRVPLRSLQPVQRDSYVNPNTGITNPNFGKILGTDGDPRILQMALRLLW